jgi:beta-phosphoglucomutase-like phosphatase (HAD superfamily)
MSSETKRHYKKAPNVIKKYLGNNRKKYEDFKPITKIEFEKFIKYYIKQNKKRVIDNDKKVKKQEKDNEKMQKIQEKKEKIDGARKTAKKLTDEQKNMLINKKYSDLLLITSNKHEAIEKIKTTLKMTDYTKMIIDGYYNKETDYNDINDVKSLIELFEEVEI